MKKTILKNPKVQKYWHFLNYDLWHIRLEEAKGLRLFFYKSARAFFIACHGFYEDMCTLRASALTFYTLMSIVPVLAMSFAVARGFGYQKHLEDELLVHFSEQKEVVLQMIHFAQNLLESVRGGLIAFIGSLIFFWSVLRVLANIEESLNHIWGIKKHRSWQRKFSDYLALLIVAPLFFILASSVTVFIVSKLSGYIYELPLYHSISAFLLFLVKLLPYGLIWVLFTFIYIFMPNTKVRFSAALTGGILAGTAYQFLQWAYITFQIGAARYNAIYGSFAALPLFLIWIQLSWYIVLMGAEISFAYQNVEKFEYGWRAAKLRHNDKLVLALWIVHQCIHRFMQAKPPLKKEDVQKKLHLPLALVDQAMQELVECKILVQVQTEKGEELGYQIARPTESLRINDVIELIENKGEQIPGVGPKSLVILKGYLQKFSETIQNTDANQLLKDILPDEHT